MADEPNRTRRVDEALLRYLARTFGRRREVAKTSLFPQNRQESLVVDLDADYYPEPVEAVRLEIRVYANGEFHVSYFETVRGEHRRCRWDRREQDHDSRDHLHPLPTASTQRAADRNFPEDVTAVIRRDVLPWVERRLGELWDVESG